VTRVLEHQQSNLMANPRQRRKARSSTHTAVRSTNAKSLRKQPPIKGPRILQEAWNKKKTVRQNYAALGLLANLNPTARIGHAAPFEEQPMDDNDGPKTASASSSLPKGKGRIVRDASGNIVSVTLGDDDDDDDMGQARRPEESIMPDHAPARPVPAKTDLVRALETLSASGTRVTRHASAHEVVWLRTLVAAHGDDVEGMVRDVKRNVWQKTGGELRRAISKAGGVARLRGA